MGTFGGHALPGSFLIAFAIWWMVQTLHRYFLSRMPGALPYKSTATFPCSCFCSRLKSWEIEGMFKIFFSLVGFAGEIITGTQNGQFVHLGNGQHATMFFFFMMSGVVDILVHHRVPLPRDIQYVAMAMAFIVEALLFKFHLHGRTEMDIMIHTFLLYAMYGNILGVLCEIKFRHSVLAALTKTFFLLLQGTWFWHVGFILYNPLPGAQKWDEESHDQMMIVTMMFAWHMAAGFIFMLLLATLIGSIYRCRGKHQSGQYDSLSLKLIKADSNGHTFIDLSQDSDSDEAVAFEKTQKATE